MMGMGREMQSTPQMAQAVKKQINFVKLGFLSTEVTTDEADQFIQKMKAFINN